MRTWLTALRIARREARRAKGRSALALAMIALPVLALSVGIASYDMFRLTPRRRPPACSAPRTRRSIGSPPSSWRCSEPAC